MLKSDIISYDYTLPSVQTLLSSTSQYTFIEDKLSTNLEHVLDYVINTLHICKENLILMSHSFGSVPTLYNASSEEFQNIAGIILVSPMFGYEKASDDDVNTVIPEHSLNFSCNCFVIHGTNDKVVSTRKVEMMCKQIRNCKWTFAAGCGHFDMFCGKERWKVYDKVRQFMNMCESVKYVKGNGNDKELDSTRVSEVVNVNETISKMKEQQEDESYNDIENNLLPPNEGNQNNANNIGNNQNERVPGQRIGICGRFCLLFSIMFLLTISTIVLLVTNFICVCMFLTVGEEGNEQNCCAQKLRKIGRYLVFIITFLTLNPIITLSWYIYSFLYSVYSLITA
jgi:predicted alpha/beta hydrolase family esterase